MLPNNQNSNPLNLYLNKQYDKLANSNLKQPIDQDGNTVLHVIASNLDKQAFENIRKNNPNAINHSTINIPNKNSELPIHKAMESVKKNNSNHEFITYMIDNLGANPNIPDINNRIIITNRNSNKSYSDDKIKQLNNDAVNNFRKFTEMAETKLGEISPTIKRKLNDMGISSNNFSKLAEDAQNKLSQIMPDLKKSSNITYNMSKNSRQNGGRNETDKQNVEAIKNLNRYYLNNRQKSTNSFVAKNKNKLINQYNNNQSQFNNQIINNKLVGGYNNNIFQNKQQTIGDRIRNYNNNLFGGASIFDDSDDDDLIFNKKDNSDSSEIEFDNKEIKRYRDMISNQSRPRNVKVDETYKSFVKKIMDLLGVDEETARLYRSAIKIEIENKNPELKRRENDELKVKEMEKMFASKKILQKAIDDIDMDKIKKTMQERKANWEARSEEIRKAREERSKQNKNKKRSNNQTTTSDETSSDNMSTSIEVPKKLNKNRKTSVVENGYVQSDEVILSSEY
ncbi:hypothetical protein [Powai lake megavirus]|uniref:Ankyrin repeat protein n=1 Tax=Powai lake megavirus TaxID=1842663 RepID=A0A167RBR8_9VIRU|nr:hypothetical protein QJ849_gp347 [Powai lake megavirus]ANB50509.1 hypothetical protein [Powai lake megavirus]